MTKATPVPIAVQLLHRDKCIPSASGANGRVIEDLKYMLAVQLSCFSYLKFGERCCCSESGEDLIRFTSRPNPPPPHPRYSAASEPPSVNPHQILQTTPRAPYTQTSKMRHAKATYNGTIIAESKDFTYLENNVYVRPYLPPPLPTLYLELDLKLTLLQFPPE